MPEIRLQHLTKIYPNNTQAVDDVSFIIEDGEYLSLIGPSGCGKTTTLRLIAGTILPTSGKIYFDNKEIEKLSIQDRHIGFVFQHFALFPNLTVWENIAYGPTMRGKKRKEIEHLVEESLKAVQLTERAYNFPRELSAPEMQKASLARVLASESKILLLDEPLGALDQKIREEFQHFLRNLVKAKQLTAIHVTHDQSEALSISDRVVVMNKGKLIQIGSAEDVIFHPNHIFSSFFVGESDFINCIIVDDKEKYAKLKVGKSIVTAHNSGLARGTRAVLAVRREFLKISSELGKAKNTIKGVIVEDKFLGLFRRVQVKLENQQIVEVKIHSKDPVRYAPNQSVELVIEPELTRTFPFPKEGIKTALEM